MEQDKLHDYLTVNKATWNNKTDIHIGTDFYDMEGFVKGNSSLNAIELSLLGDVSGKEILHLQCHFGQDTLSLARLGAEVTGVDFSDNAIAVANDLAKKIGWNANFICCDVYSLPEHLNQKFDIIYTSYGTIGWLPDIDKWAAIIAHFLKPGGQLVFVEFHPVVWMFDYDFDKIGYSYFNNGAIVETFEGTYADPSASLTQQHVTWNHSLSDVLNGLIKNGLQVNAFHEYNYSPYNCFNHAVEVEPKKFRIKHLDDKIPMVYAVVAQKC